MSVPKSQRREGKLEAQTKAYEFAAHTDRICSNEKCFAKRNRWCTTSELVSQAHRIAICVDLANSCRLANPRRLELQNEAIEATIACETLMEIAYRENISESGKPLIPDSKIEYWIGLLLELRIRIRKWREADKRRFPSPFASWASRSGFGKQAKSLGNSPMAISRTREGNSVASPIG